MPGELARLPVGFLEEIIASRAYARAVAHNDADPKGWNASELRIMAKTIEHELAAEAIEADGG